MNNRIMAVVEPEEVDVLTSSPNPALGNLAMQSEATFRVLEKNVHMTQFCEKASTKFDQMEKTDGDKSHLYSEDILVLSLPTSQPLGAIPAGTLIGPIQEVRNVKILDEYGVEVAVPSICKPGDVTYVLISTETEHFMNENHTHEAKTRFSGELLENPQESEGSMFYNQREVTTSPQETWIAPSTGETRAGFVNLGKTLPRIEEEWITIHANPNRGSVLAIFSSQTVTTMSRHFDQDERESD